MSPSFPAALRALSHLLGFSLAQILESFAAVGILLLAIARRPGRSWLNGRSDRQHVLLASIALLAVIWSFRAPLQPGLTLHFLLATTLTLMQGWRLALPALAAVAAIDCGVHADWPNWAAEFVCDAAIPVAVTQTWHVAVARTLPRNYWIFFFVTAFAGSALAFLCSGVANVSYAQLTGALPPQPFGDDYAVALVLMSFGEATLNGFILAGAITFHPEWIATIDERTYAPP